MLPALVDRIAIYLKINFSKVPTSPPVAVLLTEAELLQTMIAEDHEALIRLGAKDFILDNHGEAITWLRTSESGWSEQRFSSGPALSSWKDKVAAGFALHATIWSSLDFLFHHDDVLCHALSAIRRDPPISEMILNLSRLAAIGKAHLDLVATTDRISEATLTLAEETSVELSRLSGAAGFDRKTSPEDHEERDMARCLLQAMSNEIYRCGQHLHENNPERRDMYRSEYLHQQSLRGYANRKAGDSKDTEYDSI